jgi:hypothetical protein
MFRRLPVVRPGIGLSATAHRLTNALFLEVAPNASLDGVADENGRDCGG